MKTVTEKMCDGLDGHDEIVYNDEESDDEYGNYDDEDVGAATEHINNEDSGAKDSENGEDGDDDDDKDTVVGEDEEDGENSNDDDNDASDENGAFTRPHGLMS